MNYVTVELEPSSSYPNSSACARISLLIQKMGNSDYPTQLLCYLPEPSPAAPGSALGAAEVSGLVQGGVFRVGTKPGKVINKMLNFLSLGD